MSTEDDTGEKGFNKILNSQDANFFIGLIDNKNSKEFVKLYKEKGFEGTPMLAYYYGAIKLAAERQRGKKKIK